MKALDISKLVLTQFDYVGEPITNKKLQKLLYYIEAWSLVYHGSLIDEDFEAWVHGPVVPCVYRNYKEYGYSPIKQSYQEGETASSRIKQLRSESNLTQEQLDLMLEVIDKYGSLSSFELETLSHREKPWDNAREGCGPLDHCSKVISKSLMRDYYSSLI